jgi:putative transcriptional regulator
LTELVNQLETGAPLDEAFNYRRVELRLEPTIYAPATVKHTRALLKASQAVFARLLGVSVNSVRAWEQGINVPSSIACRFMDEIRRDPAYWIERLKSAAVPR